MNEIKIKRNKFSSSLLSMSLTFRRRTQRHNVNKIGRG